MHQLLLDKIIVTKTLYDEPIVEKPMTLLFKLNSKLGDLDFY